MIVQGLSQLATLVYSDCCIVIKSNFCIGDVFLLVVAIAIVVQLAVKDLGKVVLLGLVVGLVEGVARGGETPKEEENGGQHGGVGEDYTGDTGWLRLRPWL